MAGLESKRIVPHGGRSAIGAFWNPDFETIEPAELRPIEDALLLRQLKYTAKASPFYAAKWRDAGVDASRVRTREDLRDLPFTEKSELQAAVEGQPAFGSNQAAPLDRLIRMQATGGTTSRPMRMAMTRHDAAVYCEAGARAHWTAGVRPGDVVFECMNYAMYAGGVNDHMTFEALGACVAPVGVGQSRRLLALLADMDVDGALYSTPSYALHLAEAARAEGLEPFDPGLRKGGLLGRRGSRGRLDPGRHRGGLRDGRPERLRDERDCAARRGVRGGRRPPLPRRRAVPAELIETESGKAVPFEDDAVGELVLTTLDREAHPLVRMRTRDHVRLTMQPCACAR
ncbi:MAG: hypothetical protein M5T61_09245, partial [Acidimicrobiia bacterium]|nr:hypothetical protein [Acidimicrobiia bacterium]